MHQMQHFSHFDALSWADYFEQITNLICISTLRLWTKCPEKAKQSTGVSIALIQPAIK